VQSYLGYVVLGGDMMKKTLMVLAILFAMLLAVDAAISGGKGNSQDGKNSGLQSESAQAEKYNNCGHVNQIAAIDKLIAHENKKHNKRITKLNRMKELAESRGHTGKVNKLNKLIEKEQERYESRIERAEMKRKSILAKHDDCKDDVERVALLFVGHGEPAVFEDGDVPITLADGTPFGPHAVSLGVPEEFQYTEWAAAYEEIATAMTYIFEDLNGNGILHEVKISPAGDVPPFFTWDAFHASVHGHYQAFNNYSPHNDILREHLDNIEVKVEGVEVDIYLAFLDAVPRISDVVWEITNTDQYTELVVVPMLLASSTHTQEVESLVCEAAHMTSDMDVLVTEPFFEIPFMRRRIKKAVVAMAEYVRETIPANVSDSDIGVVLASHGTPYVPPFAEFGWQKGDIFSNLILTEDIFHDEIAQELPWRTRTGRMNYSSPSLEEAVAAFEAEGISHVIVVPSAFPTAAMHTMWDVADAVVGRAVLPSEGVVVHTSDSGMQVHYSAQGYADIEPGCSEFRHGLSFIGKIAVLEAIEEEDYEVCREEPEDLCQPGEICVTVIAEATTGPELRLMLYEAEANEWPQQFLTLPTPSWVVTEYPPTPADQVSVQIRIPLAGNLFAISSEPLEGSRLGLAIATGVASIMVVEPTDARGFSQSTMVYQPDAVMDFGTVVLRVPQGDTCDLNPFHPNCLTGPLFWEDRFIGEEGFVPGAVYMDAEDIDRDGTYDIVTVGEPHFEDPNLPLTVLKLGIYYLNNDLSVREMEIIDVWSESDQEFYSPWGVKVIDHSGEPVIIVGTNIPGLAPLEEGTGAILSYRKQEGEWVRSVVMENPNPTQTNYNAMIVVTEDIDADGDEDLALSSAFGSSAVGSWMENTGQKDNPWIAHLQTMAPGTDPYIRGTLAYKSTDLNGDGYPEVIYNAMFDIANTDPPRYRGEIWLGVNPGPQGWDGPWQKLVIDDDNWASADMWFHDFNGDGYLDLVANQIFSSTVTLYFHPGDNLSDPWVPEVIISGLTSPSDMWLADMDGDGLMDVVSADHTAHRGVWHKNPGPGHSELWQPNLIFRNIRMPGDFEMADLDEDGDLDWVGTSMTRGQAFIVEQVKPASSLVATISLPDNFSGQITKLLVTLASEIPVTGMPVAVLATIDNVDNDGDGQGDVDQILNSYRDLVLALEDVGVTGEYHVVASLYMEGGGQFQPVPGIDYMASSEKLTLGQGKVEVTIELQLIPVW
jgi:protoheme ferro-lyase